MLAGVSFLATPVKFLAPSLRPSVALEIGNYTFAAFNKAEWVIVSVLLACCVTARARAALIAALMIAVILLIDTLWLLPTLDARVTSIMRGEWPAPSVLHYIYISLDLAKLALLTAIVAVSVRRIRQAAYES
jgi:hypothetical protein